jgi:hypothetical protein
LSKHYGRPRHKWKIAAVAPLGLSYNSIIVTRLTGHGMTLLLRPRLTDLGLEGIEVYTYSLPFASGIWTEHVSLICILWGAYYSHTSL